MALAGEGGRGGGGGGIWTGGGHRRDGGACVVRMRGRQQGGPGARVCSRSIRGPGARAFARGGREGLEGKGAGVRREGGGRGEEIRRQKDAGVQNRQLGSEKRKIAKFC